MVERKCTIDKKFAWVSQFRLTFGTSFAMHDGMGPARHSGLRRSIHALMITMQNLHFHNYVVSCIAWALSLLPLFSASSSRWSIYRRILPSMAYGLPSNVPSATLDVLWNRFKFIDRELNSKSWETEPYTLKDARWNSCLDFLSSSCLSS